MNTGEEDMNDTESLKQTDHWQTCRKCKQADFTSFTTCRFCQTPYRGQAGQRYNSPGTELIYASANDRFYSYIIDTVIFIAIGYFVPQLRQPVYLPLFIASYWLYQAVLISQLGGTFGQFAVGIRVTTEEGEPVSFFRATLRFLASLLTALTGGIGNLMALGGTKHQTLHDIISRCVLIEDNGQRVETHSAANGSVVAFLTFLVLGAGIYAWQLKKFDTNDLSGSRQVIGSQYYASSKAYGASDLDALYIYAGWQKKQTIGLYNQFVPFAARREALQDPLYRDLINSRRLQALYGDISATTLAVMPVGVQIIDVIKENRTGAPVYRVTILSGQQRGLQYWLQQKEINFMAHYKP
jgi:uncharacterized RDD family membrane protein YckC